MTVRWTRWMAIVGCLMLAPSSVSAQKLIAADRPDLIDCNGRACFRATIYAEDGQGQVIPLESNIESFRIFEGPTEFRPFFIADSAGGGSGVAQRGTYWMLLVDMSGSMNYALGKTTRFEAARQAIRTALGDLREGTDFLSFVTFESHRVRETVSAATFESPAAVRARLDSLKPPNTSNNTALYSSIYEALAVLERKKREGQTVSLVVFTDGKNDVRPEKGDDKDLLGDEGLKLVRERAQQLNIRIKTIGFGARGDKNFDEEALRQLAWPDQGQYSYAADAAAVSGLLRGNVEALARQVRLLFGPVRDSKDQLIGQELHFRILGDVEGKAMRTETDLVWSAPTLNPPTFAGALTGPEFLQCVRLKACASSNVLWERWKDRLVALGLFSALLSIGWFGLPRLMWPERYIPKPDFQMPPSGLQPGGLGAFPPGPPMPHLPDRSSTPSRLAPPRGGRMDDTGAGPPPKPAPRPGPAPPRGRTAPPPRDPSDSTIYIPRGKKYEKDS